jgi:hypothetical protein
VVADPALHLIAVGDIDARGGDVGAQAFDCPDGVDDRVVGVVLGQRRPGTFWWDGATTEKRDVSCTPLGQVGGHDTT